MMLAVMLLPSWAQSAFEVRLLTGLKYYAKAQIAITTSPIHIFPRMWPVMTLAASGMTIATGNVFQSSIASLPIRSPRNWRHKLCDHAVLSFFMTTYWSRKRVHQNPLPGIRTLPIILWMAVKPSVSGYHWTR